jgi:predicted amidohydrolase YtcJ
MRLLLASLLLLAGCAASPEGGAGRGPDVLIVNARVHGRAGDALLVRDDGFVVGTTAELREQARPEGLRELDAKGGLVLPAFQDAHAHLLLGGLGERQVKLGGLRTLEECLAEVKRWAAAHPEAPWIEGGGWSYGIVPPGQFPTRQALDQAVPDRPAVLDSYDAHSAWANTKALEAAGIGPETPDPATGKIVREEDGKTPQGALLEDAAALVHEQVPDADEATQLAALELALAQFLRLGITKVHAICGSLDELARLEALHAAGKLPISVVVGLPLETPREEVLAARDRLAVAARRRDQVDADLRFGFLKGFLDGVIESKTAFMLEDYVGGERGKPNYTREELLEHVTWAHGQGIPVALHAIGDAAVRMALDTYEAAAKAHPRIKVRHRIEHLEVVHPDDLPRFAALDVVASMQPYHAVPADAPSPDDVWSANLGPERLKRSFPWRMLVDAGATLAFGSDWNVFTQDPLKGLAVAVTRQNERGLPAGGSQPHQRLTVGEALRAYTEGVELAEGRQPGDDPRQDWVVLSPGVDLSDPRTLWTGEVRAVVRRGQLTTR